MLLMSLHICVIRVVLFMARTLITSAGTASFPVAFPTINRLAALRIMSSVVLWAFVFARLLLLGVISIIAGEVTKSVSRISSIISFT